MSGQSFAGFASVIIALSALVFSIVSFRQQQNRAEKQEDRAEKLAVDSVKPLLEIQHERYMRTKAIRLRNYGLGPAVVKVAQFTKGGGSLTNKIVDLFDHLLAAEYRPAGRIIATAGAKPSIPRSSRTVACSSELDWSGIPEPEHAALLVVRASVPALPGVSSRG